MAIRRRDSGHKDAWQIDFIDADGRRRRISVRGSKRYAQQLLREALVERDRAKMGLESPVPQAPSGNVGEEQESKLELTLGQVVKRFVERVSDLRKSSTAQTYELRLVQLLRSVSAIHGGDPPVRAVSAQDIEQHLRARARSKSNATVGCDYRCARVLFNYAAQQGFIEENPMPNVPRPPRAPKGLPKALKPQEVRKLLATAEDVSPVAYAAVATALYTGLRKSELIYLAWDDVDFDQGVINLSNKPDVGWSIKNYEARSVPMPEELRTILEQLPRTSRWCFPSAKGGANKNGLHREVAKVFKAAGLSGYSLHNLRHTYATTLVLRGVPIRVVKDLMGHSVIETTMIYSHLADEEKFKAAKVLTFGGPDEGLDEGP